MNEYLGAYRRDVASQAKLSASAAFTPPGERGPTMLLSYELWERQQESLKTVDYWTGEALRREEFLRRQRIVGWLKTMRYQPLGKSQS